MTQRNRLYFASDFHLGIPNHSESLIREKKIVRWLDYIKTDAEKIFLLGDVFDFWFEYKKVIPKGFVRLQGKIAELVDAGIEIYLFKGNHDMWMFHYFQEELGIKLICHELEFEYHGKQFYLHHGDGLGQGDYGYKFIKKIFRNPLCIWLFGILPPRWGLGLAHYFSSKSRLANAANDEIFDQNSEWLLHYCNEMVTQKHFDYLIFGHRHLPLDLALNNGGHYINLGEWLHHFTYADFDGNNLELKTFEN
ncbi:MAG: UDP-2,3-diacylglucosamine diphosphatase [Flavobacteriales bacterium]|nr:UDP-2,3-diacylglucosamine diphosphatase [Flavobacteriales bacterium]